MSLLKNLIAESIDKASLENFIQENFTELYDYFTWRTDEELSLGLPELKAYMSSKRSLLTTLTPNDRNLAFLTLLLEVAERLSFSAAFKYLYRLLNQHGYVIGSRLHASAIFLNGLDTAEEYVRAYEQINDRLLYAIKEEEDSEDKVVITIVNYFLKAISDFAFNADVSKAIQNKIKESIRVDEFSYLNRPLIHDLVNVDVSADVEAVSIHLHQRLEEFLKRDKSEAERAESDLLENGTRYSEALEESDCEFWQIRRISIDRYRDCDNEAAFRSLQRGTAILKAECQLLSYMVAFGQMHHRKLKDALMKLPVELFNTQLNIVDWGCGQAIASMVLHEFCDNENIEIANNRFLLIEPSLIALERGALHLKKFNPDIITCTINRSFDSLKNADFDFLHGSHHLHLFSNILDIDAFSLTMLTDLIKTRFIGINYFVVVSPYHDGLKKRRIDTFVDEFSRLEEFALISSNNDSKGNWVKEWTRIERVFKVNINN